MPLDHAIVLVKHLVQVKTENLELENYIREMQAKMQEAGLEVADRPKHGGNSDEAGHVSEMQQVADEGEETSDYDSEDSDDVRPVPGGDLLEQIFHL